MDWATRLMRTGQIAEAHQELVDDLAAGEAKGLLEELDPFRARTRVMGIEPLGERSVRPAQFLDALGIIDRRRDLEPITDNAGIRHQTLDIGRPEGSDPVDIEFGEGGAKGRAFFEDRRPG